MGQPPKCSPPMLTLTIQLVKYPLYTGNSFAKDVAKAARTRNQAPTSTRIRPPHRLMTGALSRIDAATRWFADAITSASVKTKATMASAATANASSAAPNPPALSASPARPARIGPVQPKPART
jgi:hypothetical protein